MTRKASNGVKRMNVAGELSNARNANSSPAEPPPSAAKLKILLVEDNEADAYLIQLALARNPNVAEVTRAKDGVEALALIDADQTCPDLAIVDLHMPRKDGLALLSDLSTRASAQFPAIVLTSSTSGNDILHAWKRGAVEFITKRTSVQDMAAALDHVISNL
jgi:CheY-like chemotaxis protein